MGLLTSGGLRVAQTGDGRLALFARGMDNTLQSITQGVPGSWTSGWDNLGGIITTNPVVFPASTQGRLEVYAAGADSSLWCCYQNKPNGSATDWTWKGLKGYISSEPAVFRNADDRMEIAVADAARDTRVTYQQGKPSGTWSSEQDNWPSLGKISVGDPALIQAQDGRLAVFIRGADNCLYQKSQNAPGQQYWSDWMNHGGQLYSDPAVILHGDGTMHVFAIAASGGLAHLPQLTPNSTWGAWEDLGSNSPISHRPAPVLNASGGIEVFARVHDTHIDHYRFASGAWTIRHDTGSLAISGPTAARNADGRLEFFYRGADNTLRHAAEFIPGGPWMQHATLGGRIADL